jgi:hypothetical protein
MTKTLEWRNSGSEALWDAKSSLVGHGGTNLIGLARFLIAWGDGDGGGHCGEGQDANISNIEWNWRQISDSVEIGVRDGR